MRPGEGGNLRPRPVRENLGVHRAATPFHVAEGTSEGTMEGTSEGTMKDPRFASSRERDPNGTSNGTSNAPLPMHSVDGFLPALVRARRRRPGASVSLWRAVAALAAAPNQRAVTAAQLCTLADFIERTRGVA